MVSAKPLTRKPKTLPLGGVPRILRTPRWPQDQDLQDRIRQADAGLILRQVANWDDCESALFLVMKLYSFMLEKKRVQPSFGCSVRTDTGRWSLLFLCVERIEIALSQMTGDPETVIPKGSKYLSIIYLPKICTIITITQNPST